MTTQELSPEQYLRSIYEAAVDLTYRSPKKLTEAEVQKQLCDRGLEPEACKLVLSQIRTARREAVISAAQQGVQWGLKFLLGGAAVAGASYFFPDIVGTIAPIVGYVAMIYGAYEVAMGQYIQWALPAEQPAPR